MDAHWSFRSLVFPTLEMRDGFLYPSSLRFDSAGSYAFLMAESHQWKTEKRIDSASVTYSIVDCVFYRGDSLLEGKTDLHEVNKTAFRLDY